MTFLGHPFRDDTPLLISTEMKRKAEECVAIMSCNPLIYKSKLYIMFRQAILPRFNYAGLVE